MSGEPIDRATNASIRKAIADRLNQNFGSETPIPERFQRLIDEMRRQEQSSRRN